MGPIAPDAGAIPQIPSDHEDASDLPNGASALRPPLGPSESSLRSDNAPGHGGRHRDCYAAERESGQSAAPPSQRHRTDSQKAQDVEDEELRARLQFPAMPAAGPPVVTGRDVLHGIRVPMAEWLSSELLFRRGAPYAPLTTQSMSPACVPKHTSP